MHKLLLGIAALVVSIAILIAALSLAQLMGRYSDTLDSNGKLATRSANVLDSLITTLLVQNAKTNGEISDGDYDAIMKSLHERSQNGYLIEHLLLVMTCKQDKTSAAAAQEPGGAGKPATVAADVAAL
jgi:hypothetical protein